MAKKIATQKKSPVKASKPAKKAGKKMAPSAAKSASKKSPNNFLKINSEVWPLERDVLFRPDRYKYVRKIIKPEGCVFCKASKEAPAFETLCVYKTKHSMILLNKYPYNSGHILILPLRHCGDLLLLSDEEFMDLQNCIRKAMKALNDVYQPGGINVGLNHGATAGAGIPEHLHYHMIPRWAGDLNFFPLIAETKVLVESLEQTYERLLEYFKKI